MSWDEPCLSTGSPAKASPYCLCGIGLPLPSNASGPDGGEASLTVGCSLRDKKVWTSESEGR